MFGKVVEGLDVVDAIAGVETGRVGPFDDVPTEAVIIESVEIVAEEYSRREGKDESKSSCSDR